MDVTSVENVRLSYFQQIFETICKCFRSPPAPALSSVTKNGSSDVSTLLPMAAGSSVAMAFQLVRGQSALFLTALEDTIEVLDPAKTELVPDTSPTYNATVLYLESLRRRSVANDDKIHLGHRGVMNLVPYQPNPALQALKQPRSPHPDCRLGGPWQNAGSRHPGHRTDSARAAASASWWSLRRRCSRSSRRNGGAASPSRWCDWTRWGSRGCATAFRPTTTLSTTSTAASSPSTRSRAIWSTATTSKTPGGHHRHRRMPQRGGQSRGVGPVTPRTAGAAAVEPVPIRSCCSRPRHTMARRAALPR